MDSLRTSGPGLLLASVLGLFAFASTPALAGEVYVPNNAPTTAGPGGYSTLMNTQARSYQLVVGPQELGGLPLGARITGVTWRLSTWIVYPDWPGTGNTANYTNYDIFLSKSNNPPGSLSTTYTDNIGPDVVQVRGGPLSMSNVFFPGGALTPNVNPYGLLITFTTPYVYQGGDLLLTVRHTGNAFTNAVLDTVGSPYCQAIGVSSYTQPNNWYAQGLITMKLVFDEPTAAYCTAKINSQGCSPSIAASGLSSATATSGFVLSASNELNNKVGLVLYSEFGRDASAFGPGGLLCVKAPTRRSKGFSSGGSLPPALDCTGVFSIDFNTFGRGLLGTPPNPAAYLSIPGQVVTAQFWGRDPGIAAPNNFSLSNGLEFTVQP